MSILRTDLIYDDVAELADKAEGVARYLSELKSPSSVTDEEYAAFVETEAASAPPLSADQIATLSALLAAAEAVAKKR